MGASGMIGLAGRTAVITGAATGIGRAIARRLADERANVIANHLPDDPNAEPLLEDLVHRHPEGSHQLVAADIADPEQVASLFAGLGALDILINNAGIRGAGTPQSYTVDEFDRVIGVNLRGAFLCAQAAIGRFLASGTPGVIVTTSSIHEAVPLTADVGYTISKSGLAGMTRTLALAHARDGIRVNAVGPGATETPMNEAGWRENQKALEELERRIPLGRVADPAEIAACVAFLASDEASYVTGQTLFVDGGLMMA